MQDANKDLPIHTRQAQPTLVSGLEASEMDRENSDGLTAPAIKVAGRTTGRMVLANLRTLTGMFTREIG